MLISKFNLYKTEWLDLVFDDRNKAYGAYNLRQTYSDNMVKAMLITFGSMAVLFGSALLFRTHQIVERTPINDTTVVNIRDIRIVQPKPSKPIEPPKAAEPIKTLADPPPVATPDKLAQKPVPTAELQDAAIGPKTLSGKVIEGGIEIPDPGPGVAPTAEDTKVYIPGMIDKMPEPVGGMDAWAKFLGKNLRFPVEAQEDRISGKVFLSFIIEKDGHLSNIAVDRPAGHGFDEEALRVLKLAKAWKPGMQNGQPVRVKYSIPINFQLSEE